MFLLGFRGQSTGYDAVPGGSGRVGGAAAASVFPLHHSARILDALVGVLSVGRIIIPWLPVGYVNQLALLLLVLVAIFRRPTRSVPVWFPASALALMVFLLAESAVNGVEPGASIQRALNISLSMISAGFIASGRIDAASMLKGIGLALVLNTILFYAHVAPRPYGNYLTGYLGDKNISGMFFATVPFLIFLLARRPWERMAVLALAGGALWLTGSRTSMAAFVAVAVWMFVASRTSWVIGWATAGVLFFAFNFASVNLAESGQFAERSGSDALRAQIDAATDVKVAATHWYGKGLSTATVRLTDGSEWFFHNSYSALYVEGGVVMTIVVLAWYAGVMGLLSLEAQWNTERLAAAGALGALLLCATRLGEVFMAQIGFIVLGVALALLFERTPYQPAPWMSNSSRNGGATSQRTI